jgi:nucleotide-binding universal stress UspA family protein
MKKIIAAIDVMHFSENLLIHFNSIAVEMEGKLTVILLEDIFQNASPAAELLPQDAYPYYAEIDAALFEKRRALVKEKVNIFREICERKNIKAQLHEREGVPLEEIIIESRFADLLIIDCNTSFAKVYDSDPPKFVKDVLRRAECPVLILPSVQKEIQEIILTYSGGYSSMFAIHQFSNLFKNSPTAKITVLYVDEKNSGTVKDENLLKEYLLTHYSTVEIKRLSGDPSLEIMNYLLHKPNSLVTLGAYGRSKTSEFFHHSDAEKLLNTINTYFFITHP